MDPRLGLLRKNGVRIHCQEQPLQVLTVLAERPGELVSREELRRRVWPQNTFLDFDQALNTAVKKIRATLNDDADAPRYIETVPRRGYRFIAPVEQDPFAPSVTVQAVPSSSRRLRFIIPTAVGLLALATGVWAIERWHRASAVSAPEFDRLTYGDIAVAEKTARFTPDGASIIYSVCRASRPCEIFVQRIGSPSAQLELKNATLLSISREGELAVLRGDTGQLPELDCRIEKGTLASLQLAGGGPRQLLDDVQTGDWSPGGQLAVVQSVGRLRRLEFPIGRVLYETTGWISSPRVSPSGDAIAFLDHPVVPDDRGSVVVIDRQGSRRTLSGFWESLEGLAWTPRGDEVWFAATRSGASRSLYAVNLLGRERRLLSVAGGLTLNDISRDGRVLLSREDQRFGILFAQAGQSQTKDLSWKDWSMDVDISQDGKHILFGEEGENSGLMYEVGLRPTDGSPPVMLGTGIAQSLSPDGRWALSLSPPPREQMFLLPTGAGMAKPLEKGPIEHFNFAGAGWFPDSRRIAFVGNEPGHGSRCYAQDIQRGPPLPITKEGIMYCTISPNGLIAALTPDFRLLLYSSVPSDQPEKEFILKSNEWPLRWTPNGQFIYISQPHERTVNLWRLDVATLRREFWTQLPPASGDARIQSESVVVTADARAYAYTYDEHSSDLYQVRGLR